MSIFLYGTSISYGTCKITLALITQKCKNFCPMCLAALYSYFLPIELDKTTEQFLLGILSGYTLLDILGKLKVLCGELEPNITLANPGFNQASRHWDHIRSGSGNLMKFVKENKNILGPGFDNPPGNNCIGVLAYNSRTYFQRYYYTTPK